MLDTRASTPVIGEVLLVGVVAVVGLVLTTLAFGIIADLKPPAPTITDSDARVIAGYDASDPATVRMTHLAGDPFPVEEMAITVDATDACGKRAHVRDLPANRSTYLDRENVVGDPIVSTVDPPAAEYDPGALIEEQFLVGSSFELALIDCDVDVGETVTMLVRHEPSSTVVVRSTVVARQG